MPLEMFAEGGQVRITTRVVTPIPVFICLPVKISGGSGAPIRAVAAIE
jgi:kynurenine formamidase